MWISGNGMCYWYDVKHLKQSSKNPYTLIYYTYPIIITSNKPPLSLNVSDLANKKTNYLGILSTSPGPK